VAALELYPYQKVGVNFLLQRPVELNRKPHRLLADEQGLGKTAQAIVASIQCDAKTLLIVCPSSVKYNWRKQLIKWGFCQERDIFIVVSGADTIPGSGRVIIVNYDLVINPRIHKFLSNRTFDVCILDEAHRLKSMDAARSKMVLGKVGIIRNCFRKFLLTGTPVPNRPIEFYIVLKTLAPELIHPYTKWVDFGRHFCNGWEDKVGGVLEKETGKKWNFKGASNIEELRERLHPFMLRRELKDVYHELPSMVEEVVYLDVDISTHPEVVSQKAVTLVCRTDDFDPETEMPPATIRRIIGESKVPQVFNYLVDLLGTVDKVLVFAYHRQVVQSLEDALAGIGAGPLVIQGGVNAKKKQDIVDKFIHLPNCRVLICQIMAGGEGIDGLQQVCSNVVFAEIDWSEGGMRQAKARLYRIGQKETVFARYLIADQSLENIMAAVLERKSSVINKLMKGKTPMSIEQQLERIADALELLAKNATGQAPSKEEKAPAKEEPKKGAPKGGAAKGKEKPKGPTNEDLRDAAKNFMDNLGGTKAQAKEILKSLGADTLAELEEDKWAEAIELFNAGPEASADKDLDI
jgi:SWI/SNF-related matrix-associated actin-dependent regulator 1 of chromatin subfamily A